MNTTVTSKESILLASRKLAADRGIQAINMREVAKACGIAVGSIYNYFPSKTELITATVEDIWRGIFHMEYKNEGKDFVECVIWLFESIRNGTSMYPSFFSQHSNVFGELEKKEGRRVMAKSFVHMKNGLLMMLENDQRIRTDVFDDKFTKEDFVEFVFSNLLILLSNEEPSSQILIEVIRRLVY